MTRAEFWDADRETVMRAEAVAEERLLQLEEVLCRRLWLASYWTLTGHLPSLREAVLNVRGKGAPPLTPEQVGEKFAALAGKGGPVIPIATVGETLPFKRKGEDRG